MDVITLKEKLGLNVLNLADPTREVRRGYCGDLLSWVMGGAGDKDAWITIMTNRNIIAVATLADVPCVIICEGWEAEESLVSLAKEKGVYLLTTDDDEFTVAGKLYNLLGLS